MRELLTSLLLSSCLLCAASEPPTKVLENSAKQFEVMSDLSGIYLLQGKIGDHTYSGTVTLGRLKQVQDTYIILTTITTKNGSSTAQRGIGLYSQADKILAVTMNQMPPKDDFLSTQYMKVATQDGKLVLQGRWLANTETEPGTEIWQFLSEPVWLEK